jgi:membrane protease YdiL (CAAX protease family)
VSTATENPQPASSSSSLRRFVARCPVAAFLVMLYSVTWIIFLPVVLQGRGLLVLPIGISEGLALNVAVFAIASMLGVALPPLLFTLFLPEVLLPFLFIQIFEEAGWTGFIQHTLQSATGPCVPASWWRRLHPHAPAAIPRGLGCRVGPSDRHRR